MEIFKGLNGYLTVRKDIDVPICSVFFYILNYVCLNGIDFSWEYYGMDPNAEASSRTVAYPGILFGGGGGESTNSAEDREWGSGSSGPLVRGSGDSCNLVFWGGGLNPPKPPPSVRHCSR
jgi:hypothetical protein